MKAMEKEPVYWLEKYPFELPLLNASYQKVVDWLEKYPKVSLDKRGKSIHIKHNDFIRYPQELGNGEKGTLIHITCTQSGLVITGHHHYLAKLENEQPLPGEWLKTFIENITLYFNTFELPTAQVDAGKPEVDAGKYDELCRKWGNKKPHYDLHPIETKIIFESPVKESTLIEIEDISYKLNERQKKALDYVYWKEEITRREYMQITKVSNKTAYLDLKDLIDKGLLVQVGKGRGVKYRRKGND